MRPRFRWGCLSSVFSLAYRAYLPSIVDSGMLLAGNSRLQATDSVSEIAGPGLTGVLIQLLRAPFALLAGAASFLFSATMVAHEPALEREQAAAGEPWLRGIMRDIRSGHLSASQIGVVYAAFGVGGVVAATALRRVTARLGYGPFLLAGYAVGALAIVGIPFVAARRRCARSCTCCCSSLPAAASSR